MKISIPIKDTYPKLKHCITIDLNLGDEVVKITCCRNCIHAVPEVTEDGHLKYYCKTFEKLTKQKIYFVGNDYCSLGKEREEDTFEVNWG